MEFRPRAYLNSMGNLHIIVPVGYLPFMNLTRHTKFVLTDYGGMHGETSTLNISCLVMRLNMELFEMFLTLFHDFL